MQEVIKLHHYTIDTVLKLDIWDSRLINCTLKGKDQGNTFSQLTLFPVDLIEFARQSGLRGESKKAYDLAVASAKKLRDIPLNIKLPDGSNLYTSLVFEVIAKDDIQMVALKWNPDFIPLISGDMQGGKFMFPRVAMTAISSNKRYGLYLLIEKGLCDIKRKGELILYKEEIREVLGIEDGTYKEWKDVTKRFIKPTLSSIFQTLGIRLYAKALKHTVVITREGIL